MNWEALYRSTKQELEITLEKLENTREILRKITNPRLIPFTLWKVMGLTPSEAVAVNVIASKMGGVASRAEIKGALLAVGSINQIIHPEKVLNVFICKARKKLLVHGIRIHTVRHGGYTMSPEDCERVVAMDQKPDAQDLAA